MTKKGVGNKTISESVPATDALHIKEEVGNYKRFKQLADEYTDVCEKLSQLEDSEDEGKKTKHINRIRRGNISVCCERIREVSIR